MDIFLRMLWLISKIKFRYTRNLCMFNMFFAKKTKQKQTNHPSQRLDWDFSVVGHSVHVDRGQHFHILQHKAAELVTQETGLRHQSSCVCSH